MSRLARAEGEASWEMAPWRERTADGASFGEGT